MSGRTEQGALLCQAAEAGHLYPVSLLLCWCCGLASSLVVALLGGTEANLDTFSQFPACSPCLEGPFPVLTHVSMAGQYWAGITISSSEFRALASGRQYLSPCCLGTSGGSLKYCWLWIPMAHPLLGITLVVRLAHLSLDDPLQPISASYLSLLEFIYSVGPGDPETVHFQNIQAESLSLVSEE